MNELSDKNLANLKKLLVVLNEDALSRSEFTTAFEQVVKLVVKIQEKQNRVISELQTTYAVLLERVRHDHTSSLTDLRRTISDEMESFVKKHTADIEKKLASVRDGRDADENKIVEDVLAQLPPAIILDGPKELRDKLEALKGEERLDVAAIRGLEEKITELEKKVAAGRGGRLPVGPNANAIQVADLTSQCDGSNKTFITPKFRVALMLVGTQFPNFYRPTTDFTLGNGKIILTAAVTAPTTSQTLTFLFLK